MKAVVLAAGIGTRLKPLTNDIPKVMVEVNGKPILQRVLEQLKWAGIEETILVVCYKREKIEHYFGNEFQGMKLKYAAQEKPNAGTADAMYRAKPYIRDRFLAAYADNLWERSIFKRLKELKSANAIVATPVQDVEKYGILKVEGNKILDWVEKPKKEEAPSNLANAGLYLFSPKIFDCIEKISPSPRGELELTDAVRLHLKEESYEFVPYEGTWIDIGNFELLEKANKLLKEKGDI
ncbi:MAG: sugar phosphate nucleotidyltransferase [Candidatus Diapherotrites archaeon]